VVEAHIIVQSVKRINMKIAITGTIGSGKTAVSNYLRKLGYDVFDCDEVNRRLLKEKAYELLFNDFSECFIDDKLDKTKLSSIVFEDKEKKDRLESIMHPLIFEELKSRKDNPLFAEVPLLFESGWDEYFDEKILVVCDENTALLRLQKRGISVDEAINRIKNQMSVQEKINKATRIIYNNGSLDELYEAVDSYLERYVR